jgi:hypothetical protein
MSRAVVVVIAIVVIFAGALFFLSSQAREVQTKPVQVNVTNAINH